MNTKLTQQKADEQALYQALMGVRQADFDDDFEKMKHHLRADTLLDHFYGNYCIKKAKRANKECAQYKAAIAAYERLNATAQRRVALEASN